MSTSNYFFESISKLLDNISSIFNLDKELTDPGSDSYYRINPHGRTELTINYIEESIFISHTSHQNDRIINIKYITPTSQRINEIATCLDGLAT